MTIKAKKSKINLREKLAELLNFRQIRDRLDGLGLYLGKDRTGTAENVAVRGGANVDDLQLAEISAALGGTAVDVFVYDTRNDSDGGKWRERTSHTSWYNEELNTATRGGRREFPAVAVIVSEINKVTIYDGDDPDLNMWMVFNASSGNWLWYGSTGKASVMLNGKLTNCAQSNARTRTIDFISDSHREYSHTDGQASFSGGIIQRNSGTNTLSYDNGTIGLVDRTCNDVAMTVLPNAPIDDNTGLPVPTIAVATDGGVSVIKDDGSVVDIGYGNSSAAKTITYIEIEGDVISFRNAGYQYNRFTIPSSDVSNYVDTPNFRQYDSSNVPSLIDASGDTATMSGAVGSDLGLSLLDENTNNFSSGMIAYTTSSYNTGWMPGDIKLATLSDIKIETVGVDETTELIDLNDGYADGGSWTINSNTQVSTTTSTDALNFYRTGLTTQSGKKYTATLTITNYTGSGTVGVSTLVSGAIGLNFRLSANGTKTIQFNGSNEEISLFYRSTNTATMELSIKETGELITNGTFDDEIEGWEGDGTSIISWNSSGYIDIDRNGSSSFAGRLTAQQAVSGLKVGSKYIASADVINLNVKFNLSVYTGGTLLSEGPELTSVGVATIEFIATSESHIIGLGCRGSDNATATVDNVSLRLAEDDRSVNNNGLQVFGEIDKTPVAPGADLVAYSGFSADDYLMQPYNSDLDFGTGDFCVMGWFKRNSNSTYHRIWNRSDDGNNHRVEFVAAEATSGFTFYTRDDSLYTQVTGDLPLGIWTHLVGIRENGTLKIYENGILANSATGDIRDLTSENNAVLEIGKASFGGAGPAFDGSIALFRISATVPTDEQIAKIYRDEKVLFQDGAQATLYGTSDAVTALAYDDKTELLHVGTSSGRSDFSGLRRINNTTTAVTTSISASNNLIAEQ
jgi:hypothetical protein